MALPAYETILNILREAGFVLRVKDETVNFAGAVITTAYANYISPSADDATPTVNDLQVTVNGAIATIASFDAVKGTITLDTAPTASDIVLVSYYYSPIQLDFAAVAREDAECAILSKMKGVDPCAPYTEDNVPPCVRMITRLWAGGLLLAKEYGYNTDTENTSKDGYRKIQEAKDMLQQFYDEYGACGSGSEGDIDVHGGSGSILAGSHGNMFGCPPSSFGYRCGDDCFTRDME